MVGHTPMELLSYYRDFMCIPEIPLKKRVANQVMSYGQALHIFALLRHFFSLVERRAVIWASPSLPLPPWELFSLG